MPHAAISASVRNIGCPSFRKGSPLSLPAIPRNLWERPVSGNPAFWSDTILQKARGKQNSYLSVSNTSLQEKSRRVDFVGTKRSHLRNTACPGIDVVRENNAPGGFRTKPLCAVMAV